jgi:hypothetical protein
MTDTDTRDDTDARTETDNSGETAARTPDTAVRVAGSPDEPAVQTSDQTLGTIVESNSQMDYAVEVYRERDREEPPEADDYEFGQPVYARTQVAGTEYALVGVVYDSVLVAPDQGRETPRLSSPDEDVFVPSYVDERQTILGVAALGYAELELADGDSDRFTAVDQQMPRWTLDVDDTVRKLSATGFRQFHHGPDGLRLHYYDRLLATAGDFGVEVTLSLLDRLRAAGVDGDSDPTADDQTALLDVIERQVRWNAASDRGVVR